MNWLRRSTCLALIFATSVGMANAGTPYLVGDGEAEVGVLGPDGKPPKMEIVTYLGVTTKPVDPTLRAQLDLPDGVGLTVMTVDHNGPASADIQADDVLQKLDDQLLIDTHQLVTLIHLHKPGDAVTLGIIRKAQPMQVTIQLGQKQRVVAPPGGSDRAIDLPGDKSPDDKTWAVPFDTQLPLGPTQTAISFKDDTYSAYINTTKDGHKTLVVKDMANNTVATGPVDTDEQWQKFSPEIRSHLDVMHKMLQQQK